LTSIVNAKIGLKTRNIFGIVCISGALDGRFADWGSLGDIRTLGAGGGVFDESDRAGFAGLGV